MRRSKVKFIVSGVLLFLVFYVVSVVKSNYVVPILMYHSVAPLKNNSDRLTVSPGTFDRQMRFLKENKYNVVFLEEIADLIRSKKRIPPKTVAVTFDDGYKDNFRNAFPILKKYNLKASIFIIFNEVGRVQNDRLSWKEIMLMRDSGLITFGSHAIGPEPLINIRSSDEVKWQIFQSKKMLEEKLSSPVAMFSYPEGRFTPQIRQFVIDAGYTLAVATSPGKKFPDDDVYLLKRLRISENAGNLFVFWIETSGYYTFIKEHRRK